MSSSALELRGWLPVLTTPLATILFTILALVVAWRLSRRIDSVTNSAHTTFPFGACATCGRRQYMEDRFCVAGSMRGNFGHSFYGVFDGHGGPQAADFCAANLCRMLKEQNGYLSDPVAALKKAYAEVDVKFLAMARARCWEDGSTAVCALVQDERVYVANAGDSRAVIVTRAGTAVAMSKDHKPHDEMERVKKAGGSVTYHGTWRVEGILAVSRSIGDLPLKRYVIPDPDVIVRTVSRDDMYLVLASDGLWDVLSNADVAALLAKQLLTGQAALQLAAEMLVKEALRKGSMDNVTALVVDLRQRNSPVDGASEEHVTSIQHITLPAGRSPLGCAIS